ncbi:MAG: M1 family metallopeptidase [Bacteroidota bacterium]
MVLKTIQTIVFSCLTLIATSQKASLHMPKEISAAYEKGTRDLSGAPGQNYWQNIADYQIKVAVDTENRSIRGSEIISYTNNSPNDLRRVVLQLTHDVFKAGTIRNSPLKPEDIGQGVKILSANVEGREIAFDGPQVLREGTILSILLDNPLKPGRKLSLSFTWEQDIPWSNDRTGAADSSTFFLAYWYPKVAVYDDVFGWDAESFEGMAEFYHDLANYAVTITAPSEFTVWATGVLQNAEEVFNSKTMTQYQEALSSEETVEIVSVSDIRKGVQHKSGSWRFSAEEVPDFAFALSDHYVWDAAVQQVEDREVLVSSAYPAEDAAAYRDFTQVQRKGMKHFSEDVPAVPYPYPRFTTVIGLDGGGMEYPMMAYNDGPGVNLALHEMFHTWFPMYVRINEKKYAWMDEGWAEIMAALVENRFWNQRDLPPQTLWAAGMEEIGTSGDVPLMVPSNQLGDSYYYTAYALPAFIYSVIYDELGEELFMQCFREYVRRWAKKSPTPYDFFYTFEDVAGKDLSWIWKPWFFEFGTADIQIEEASNERIVISNKGSRPVPLVITVRKSDGTEELHYEKASIWEQMDRYTYSINPQWEVTGVNVNAGMPDEDITDNFYPSLQQQMAAMDFSDEVLGTYEITQFGYSVEILMQDGLLRFVFPSGTGPIMLPGEKGVLQTLDKSWKVKFVRKGARVQGFKWEVSGYGTFEGVKR